MSDHAPRIAGGENRRGTRGFSAQAPGKQHRGGECLGVGRACSADPFQLRRESPRWEVEDLGRAPFAPVHEAMLALASAVADDPDAGRVLLVEHDPVYTAGRATPADERVDGVVPIERGGKLTFHGPGQLVVYPIVALPRRDVRAWLQSLERLGVAVCARFGLDAQASVDGTGVFVGSRKVASIGVAIRRWVNLHGIAINVAMNLDPFLSIRPCGLDPEVISDLSREVGAPVSLDEARAAVRAELGILA